MPRKDPVLLSPPAGGRTCCFCGLEDDNEFEYGKFHEHDGIITHYYCLLFSSNMQQRGLDHEGILGFLPEDINKELRRGRRLACCYCKKLGATLGCCNTKCKKIFHFPCGLKAGSLHQYFGEFRSYCIHHRLKQNIDASILKEIAQCETKICYICYDEVEPRDNLRTIWAPCCKKNAWFHRSCVQQLAMSAGYFFKCPLCNNKIEFQRAMLDHGIFIPSQDASWELVPNAFQELLYRHNRCDAETCHCPKGREYSSTNAKWELTLCRTCGSQGIHTTCGNLKWGESMWECGECISILNKSELSGADRVSRLSDDDRVSPKDRVLLTEDDSSNDSDISVGTYSAAPARTAVSSSLLSQSSTDILERPANVEAESGEKSRTTKPDDGGHRISSKALDNDFGQRQETRRIPENSDELSPRTKKPKVTGSSVDPTDQTGNYDSDDDIIVVSGPSRKKKFPTVDIPWAFSNSLNKQRNKEKKLQLEAESLAGEDTSEAEMGLSSSIDSSTTTTTTRVNSASNDAASTIETRVPIEIDLSDSESASTTSLSSAVPELNIQITNVTSLAPEAFDSAPGCFDRTIEASTNNAQRYTTERLVGNQVSERQRIYERMEIVRLQHTSDTYIPTNSVLYGLTIPGTCNTVPLIISAPELPSSTLTTASQGGRTDSQPQFTRSNDNSSVSLTTNNLASTQSPNTPRSNGENSTVRARETPKTILPKPNASTSCDNEKSNLAINSSNEKSMGVGSNLTYSVPLETVVNDQILQSRSVDKSGGKTSLVDSSMRLNEKRVKSVIMRGPRNRSKSSNSPSEATPIPLKDLPLSEVVSSSVAQAQATGEASVPAESHTAWNMPTGLTITRVTEEPDFPVGPTGSHARNGYSSPLAMSMNSSWTTNGYAGSLDPDLRITPVERSWANMQYENTANIDIDNGRDLRSGEKLLQASSDNCDGDAGSGSAVQSASDEATKSSRITGSSDSQLVAATDCGDSCSGDRKIEEKNDGQHPAGYVARKSHSPKRSITGDRNNTSDRTGLMDKTINLRDVKFTVSDFNIVKMTLYESYYVNINVEIGKKRRKSSLEISSFPRKRRLDFSTHPTKNALIFGNETGNIADNDFEDLPSSPTKSSTAGPLVADDSELSNQSGDNTQTNVASSESETRTSELSRAGVNSRGQDELKENLNPVASPTNVANEMTSVLERKSKTRLRDHGANKHTMQMLNVRESPEKMSDENDNGNSHKIINNDQSLVKIPPKNAGNCWKDNAYGVARRTIVSTDEDTNSSRNSYDPRNESYTRKSRTRASCANENSEINNHVEPAAKRLKFIGNGNFSDSQDREKLAADESKNDQFTAMSRLVSNVERTRSLKKIPRTNAHKNGKSNVNNMIKDRGRTRETREFNGKTLPCCKVSIDLARIRSILADKLDLLNKKQDSKLREGQCKSDNENGKKKIFRTKSFHCDVPKRSRSLVNSKITETSPCRFSVVQIRRWKSAENLDSLTRRSRRDDRVDSFRNVSFAENTRRGCKRKTRSFEKHDCVR